MNKEKLYNKIIDLFEYREFPFLFELAGATANKKVEVMDKLVDLQTQIYYLDEHLESNWEVDYKQLDHWWNEIYRSLSQFGIKRAECYEMTAHIRKYQKHELELRSRLFPTRFSMTFFYFYKSCDVKLLRTLLYKSFPKLNRYAKAGDWRFFDFVTEVNDDVEDVFEDVDTINANRFLISLYQLGQAKTKDVFNAFLEQSLVKSIHRYQDQSNELTTLIHTKTVDNIRITKDLIEKNAAITSTFSQNDIEVFKYLTLDQRRTG